MDSPYWKGPLPGVDVQRPLPVETFRAQAEQHSGVSQKVFGFSPESVFALRPECCSESARNPVRLHPGRLFALPRNTHAQIATGLIGVDSQVGMIANEQTGWVRRILRPCSTPGCPELTPGGPCESHRRARQREH